MGSIGIANLVFESVGGATVLSVAAGVGLLVEVILLALRCQSVRGGLWAELGLTMGALFAGPIVAAGGALVAIRGAQQAGAMRGRLAVRVGLAGTGLFVLGALVWPRPVVGSVLVLAVLSAVWSVRAYRKTTSPISRRQRVGFLATRLLVIFLATLWALQPHWTQTRADSTRGVILIGVDVSASMARKDMAVGRFAVASKGGVGRSRLSGVVAAMKSQAEALDGLREMADIRFFQFSRSAGALATDAAGQFVPALPASPTGEATAMGDSSMAALDALASEGADVRALVLVSDGCNNTAAWVSPEMLAGRLASRAVAVHTVGVGADTVTASLRALTVTTTGAPEKAAAFQRMDLQPVVRVMGLRGRTVKILCQFGPAVIATESRVVETNDATISLRISHVPVETGFCRVQVTASLVPDGSRGGRAVALEGQPRAESLVQVTDNDLRVLYIEGRFRYETKFIAEALRSSKRITLDRCVLHQPLRKAGRSPLGERLEDWLGYHVILLGDVSADSFSAAQLEHIKTLVDQYGKGVAMIGGRKSFGGGGWQDTPLAAVLPVDLSRSAGQITQPVQPVPTRGGLLAAWMHIGGSGAGSEEASATACRKAWASLPPMPGANRLVAKPAATVLAKGATGEPMILYQRFGKGRALAIAFDTTWRWALSPPVEAKAAAKGAFDGAVLQKRFWRQAVLMLANPKGSVWVQANRASYDLDALATGREQIEVVAGAEDARGVPIADGPMRVTLTGPDGQVRPVALGRSDRMWRGVVVPPQKAGVYTLRAVATVEGQSRRAEQTFTVVQRDLEALAVLADTSQLRAIARAGNGQYVPLRELGQLLAALKPAAEPRYRDVVESSPILPGWRWPVLLAIIGLLLGEWIVRKRIGLV